MNPNWDIPWYPCFQRHLDWESTDPRVRQCTSCFRRLKYFEISSLPLRAFALENGDGWVGRPWNVAVAADCSGSDSDLMLLLFRSSGNGRTMAWPCSFLPFGREACLFGWFWVAKKLVAFAAPKMRSSGWTGSALEGQFLVNTQTCQQN